MTPELYILQHVPSWSIDLADQLCIEGEFAAAHICLYSELKNNPVAENCEYWVSEWLMSWINREVAVEPTATALSREGYDSEGYDREGYGRDGYNRDGYNRKGFGPGWLYSDE